MRFGRTPSGGRCDTTAQYMRRAVSREQEVFQNCKSIFRKILFALFRSGKPEKMSSDAIRMNLMRDLSPFRHRLAAI